MKIYSLLGVFILLAGSFYLASAQNQSMYAGQMNTSSPEEPSEPLEPLEPLIPIENIDLFDGTVSTLALSHVCLDTEQKRNRFDFKVIEPSEVAFQYSEYMYVKGWGQPLTLKYVNLQFDVVDKMTDKILGSFTRSVYSNTQELVNPEAKDKISLPEGEYSCFFNGGIETDVLFMGDASEGGGLVVGEGNIGIIPLTSVLPPPTCYISVTVSSHYLPNADDSSLNITDEIPVYDTTFDPIPLKLESTRRNAVYDFISNTGEDSNILAGGNLTVNYYDDFGRPDQTVQRNYMPGKDLAILNEYDIRDNISRSWLPAVLETNGGAPVSAAVFQEKCQRTYGGETVCYSDFKYEHSSLNRLVAQYGPGDDWRAHSKGITMNYLTNIEGADTLDCWHIKTVGATSFYANKYATGRLQVTRTKNEDGAVIFEFKDFDDRVILSRLIEYSDTGKNFFDTYYVYDDLGHLTAVLPPKLSDTIKAGYLDNEQISNYAFLYVYGVGDYLTAKKLPDADWVYYLYDRSGRAVFSQDGNQRNRNEWSFHLTDRSGRECITGTCKNTFNHEKQPLLVFDIDCTYMGNSGNLMGYAVNRIKLVSPVVYTANFYDHYHFIDANVFPKSYAGFSNPFKFETSSGFAACHPSARGLLTGTVTARLDDSGATGYDYCAMYYDQRDRLIQTRSTDLRGRLDVEMIAYNYTGQPTKSRLENRIKFHVINPGELVWPDGVSKEFDNNDLISGKDPGQGLVEVFQYPTQFFTYTYDDWGRLLTITHRCEDNPQVTLVDNEYDHLGRLCANKRNGNPNLRTDYDYNIRSWTKSLSGSLFSQTLYYQDDYARTQTSSHFNTPSYSGNISAMKWTVAGDRVDNRAYAFDYDALSRLTSAAYFENDVSANHYATSYSYDKNTNLTKIYRHGRTGQETFGVLDRLNMTYTGNRLRTLTEQAEVQHLSRTVDFQVENTEPIIGEEILMSQFEYDNNGNLTKDKSRGISSIRYNLLNLPSKLSISNSDGSATQHYLYSADGRKLRMTVLTPRDTLKREYVGNYIYENGSLKRILVDGGYIQDGQYCFFLTDHLGNTRVTAKADGTVLQTNHYYPYGLPFAEGIGDSDQPYKYNGKEFDPTCGLNLYDYGARFMDPTLGGRFITPDPLAEKYGSLSPYAYCAGNPVKFIDPDGRKIDFSGMSAMTMIAIIMDLRNFTGLDLSYKNGELVYGHNEDGTAVSISDNFSATARDMLIGAIDHEERVTVTPTFEGSQARNENIGPESGMTVMMDRSQIGCFVRGTSNDLDSRTMGYGMTFLHELGHTKIGGNRRDYYDFESHGLFGQTGPNVDYMNQIRRELGSRFGERFSYPSRKRIIPFSLNSFNEMINNKIPHRSYIRTN